MTAGVSWVAARDLYKPPPLYSWDVSAQRRGHCVVEQGGVTDDRDVALRRVQNALLDAPPGAHGTVRRVALSPFRLALYEELYEVARAHRDETGDVAWTEP